MCFQSSINRQFEFIQTNWANNRSSGFYNMKSVNRQDYAGRDPLIGRGNVSFQWWPVKYNDGDDARNLDFCDLVTLKGGEYFFAPSVSFLSAPSKIKRTLHSLKRKTVKSASRKKTSRHSDGRKTTKAKARRKTMRKP